MDLSNLKIAKGSRHLPKRVGLGLGSGMGKTSTRGQKGQGARQGSKVPLGFEGGQLPLYRRIPKHGFVNCTRVDYVVVNIADLDKVFKDGASVDDTSLLFADIIHNLNKPVKVLGQGKLTKKLNITVQAYSKSAKEAIEKAGGKANINTIKDARVSFKATLKKMADAPVAEEK
ncbi:MAG: 50S ribosomal protein L15 [Bacilli bacterium]|jgi:large subunit ribosomal protein L15